MDYVGISAHQSSKATGKEVSSKSWIFGDSFLMSQISEKGIPYSLFRQLQESGPLHLQEWADIIGLSSKTLTRYRKDDKVFEEEHSAVILCVTEVLSLGMEVFGTCKKLRDWLEAETFALGSRTPLSLLGNAYGRDLVLNEIHAIEHGIFA